MYQPTKEEIEGMGFYQDKHVLNCDTTFTKECSFAIIRYRPSTIWKWYIEGIPLNNAGKEDIETLIRLFTSPNE